MSGRWEADEAPDDDDLGYLDDERDEGPAPRRSRRRAPRERRRSNAAIPAALAVLLVGLALGHYTILVPGLLGLALLSVAVSFLSSRINPFSVAFYLTVKPSWTAIGTVVGVGLVLLLAAYGYYLSGFGPLVPGLSRLP
ncbi:MAG TPA: hypothetical protein VGV64_01210 [Thermoplasmata archaeon]|nr:hypothetical protein [Thermoplasmata archaeon]